MLFSPDRYVDALKLAAQCHLTQQVTSSWSSAKRLSYRDEAITIVEALGEASPLLARRLAGRIETYAAYF